MKAYFTASVVGKKQHLSDYARIIDLLKSRGLAVYSEHVMEATEETIRLKTKEERLKFINILENWITDCDCLVAETTFPSISVGYEISLALHRDKPVLILYSEGQPPSLIAFHHEDKVICEQYTTDTLADIIDDFINFARGSGDIRFTFFITPQISAFLEKIAKFGKIPKSVYLRKLIENDMKKQQIH